MLIIQQVLKHTVLVVLSVVIASSYSVAQASSKSNLQYYQGISLLKKGAKTKSIQFFKKTVQSDTTHEGAYLMLIKLHLNLNQPDKAKSYMTRLSQLQDFSPDRILERDYYLAYNDLLDQNYQQATTKLKATITAAYQLKQFDFFLLSKCYNTLGYIDAIQQPIERSKDKLIVSNRALQNAKALLEEALRYNPNAQITAKNYNIVTTALRVQPFTIEPYQKSQLEEGGMVVPSFTAINSTEESSVLPDNMGALTEEWNNFEEVILMLDASGSMRTMVPNTYRSRFEQGKQVANYFLDHFATKVKIGLVAVAGECGFAPKLSSSTLQNRTDLSNLMQDVKADGHTPINDALKLVPNLFQTNAKNKAVIFITDGIDSCDPKLTCELTASLGANGISVHIINLESIVSPEEYENYLCMTVSSGGMLRYINTSNQIELYDQFDLEDYLLLPKLETPKSTPDKQSVASL